MTCTPVQYPINIRQGSEPRTPGIHLSGILRPLAIQGHLFKADPDEVPLDDLIGTTGYDEIGMKEELMRLIVGFAWENYIKEHLPQVVFHPGEYELDGVVGTPDGLEFRRGLPPLLHEAKATWKSQRWDFETRTLYLWQGAGYLRMVSEAVGMRCTECVFHPLYVMGDYRGRFPLYEPVHVQFEWAEIESYWAMIQRHKHLAVPETGQV